MAATLRRPDLKHDEQVRNLARFLTKESGDSGVLHTSKDNVEFEVARRESIRMDGGQTGIRLVCTNMATDDEFNLDSNLLHTYKIDWD